jgi:hypothetical protein
MNRMYDQSLLGLIFDRVVIIGFYALWIAICASPFALAGLAVWVLI